MVFGMKGGGHPFYKIQDKRGLPAVSVGGQFYLPCYDANGIKRAPSPSRQARGDRDFKATTKEWSEERYPATQRQQSVTKYIDESGNVVAAYVYGDFGETLERSGPMADVFPHRFSTKYHDGETGLCYYGYRFYNPVLKRWMTEDPMGISGGINLYLFCNNATTYTADTDGRWAWLYGWTEEKARQAVREEIEEMRKNGYNFAADALEHYLVNTTQNIDLSRYANEISSHPDWRRSFFNNVLKQLQAKDPNGTNKKVEIGDIAHRASFSANLQTGGMLTRMFTTQFDHRFHQWESMGLFYALYGSYYSYVGTASWCRKHESYAFLEDVKTKINVDLQVVCYDMLSYGGWQRATIRSYSAAQYLQTDMRYRTPFIFLRWRETGTWEHSEWYTLYSRGELLRKVK